MAVKFYFHPMCLLFSAATFSFMARMVSGFEQNCQTNEKGDINCSFLVRDSWSLLEFRDWLDHIAGNIGDVSLNLICTDGAKVFLPFPYRARNLRKLFVIGCVLDGFYSEFYPEPIYPDSLRETLLEDVVILVDIQKWKDVMLQPIYKSTTCGHETVVKDTERNLTYSFLETLPQSSFDELFDAYDIYIENSKSLTFACYFGDLQEIEITKQTNIAKQSFDLKVTMSSYPRLQTFNYSSNFLRTIPPQLVIWWKHFPALVTLDLSNNNFSNFSFEHPDLNQHCVYINLANNNISSVPMDIPTYLTGSTVLLINLLGNPIHCDCAIYALYQYLQALPYIAPQYSYLSNVKCHSPDRLAGKEVQHLSFDYCNLQV